ncbi:MAG: hypothetical protein LBU68_03120 [Rickettsiales bacterium]|jgi:type II secretory pathway predicted ATPase ExeA|nr:hypothetical protein [Rickettsiales bacterium]
MSVQSHFSFDSLPFCFTNELCSKFFIKSQGKIIDTVINSIRFENKIYHHIYGNDSVGKSFILQELYNILSTSDVVIARTLRDNKISLSDQIGNFMKKRPSTDEKMLERLEQEYSGLERLFVIIDDVDGLKPVDIQFLNLIVKVAPHIGIIISSGSRNISERGSENFIDISMVRHRVRPLSMASTYSYIRKSIAGSFALRTNRGKKIFSFASVFWIYLLSAGKLGYINSIATFCLEKAVYEDKEKISIMSVFEYAKSNLQMLRYNTLVLFLKWVGFIAVLYGLFFISRMAYIKINEERFDRIRQEIELENLKNSLAE